VLDINGQLFQEKGLALLLCEILDIQADHLRIRIMNSEMELAVGAEHDEVLGGMVADSELTVFVEGPADGPDKDSQADGVKSSAFE
jgi:hypothetical protein